MIKRANKRLAATEKGRTVCASDAQEAERILMQGGKREEERVATVVCTSPFRADTMCFPTLFVLIS